jgi:hypothetical protein
LRVGDELGDMYGDKGPDQTVVDISILVGQDIALGDDLPPRDNRVCIPKSL